MSGSYNPIRCCDSECAAANHCQIGGIECDGCGNWFCAEEISMNGLCCDCEEERSRHVCVECGEWSEEGLDDEGVCQPCRAEELHYESLAEEAK